MKTRLFSFYRFLLFTMIAVGCHGAIAEETETDSARWSFFALCFDTHDECNRSLDEQATLLAELGYDGLGHLWLDQLPERVETAHKNHLKVFQVYFSVAINGNPHFDSRLKEILPCLKGEGTQLAVLITGAPPSDPSQDDLVVAILEEILEITTPLGVQVVLYPHWKDYCESVHDAIRIAKRFPNNQVKVQFNLCHWLAIDQMENLAPLLHEAKPHLAAVSLHGADLPQEVQTGSGNWIQPLDSGSFDIASLLRILKEIDYRGPIGLQCYGLPGDAREHLQRSINAWRKLNEL